VAGDLADLDQVDALAADVLERTAELHVLVNNAGIYLGPAGQGRQVSADGIELRFAVNYLAGVLLTRRLLPLLRRSAPARIVNVASVAQQPMDPADPLLQRHYDAQRAYAQSKLAQIMFTFDLAEELPADQVTVNALHPATLMPTGMVREAGVPPVSTLEEGLAATLRLVANPELSGVSGRYFDGVREAQAHPAAYDPAARDRLRSLTEQLLADRPAR